MARTRAVGVMAVLAGLVGCSAADRADTGRGGASGAGGAGQSGAGAAGGGAGTGTNFGDCGAIGETADNQLQPADIIFAIDNSGSMDEEIVFVRENMNAFSQRIVDSGIDVRIILISSPIGMTDDDGDDDDQDNGICIDPPLGSGSCPDDSNLPRYLHVPQEVESHDALNLFVSTYPSWRQQLRPNATKTFVVVTDDNAEDEPNDSAVAFTQAVMGLDPGLFAQWKFAGIYCFSECPEAAEIGRVYMDLVTQTQGVAGDLCLQDFAPVFDALAQAVIGDSRLDCEWAIPPTPAGLMFDENLVNVQYTLSGASTPTPLFAVPSASACDARGGWHYDDPTLPTRVLACPATCALLQADPGATLDVLFGCETAGPD